MRSIATQAAAALPSHLAPGTGGAIRAAMWMPISCAASSSEANLWPAASLRRAPVQPLLNEWTLMDNYSLDLPESLTVDRHDCVAVLAIRRAHKRNALNSATVQGIGRFFASPPPWAKSVVITSEGEHFSSGLDLSELNDHDAVSGIEHSRMWHRAFAQIEAGPLPAVAALKGATIGGGLELAAAAHLRVAEESSFFAFPEGERGLFVGGGGSVRVPRLIGAQRMRDMMLTGRVLSSAEAERAGLVDYVVPEHEGLDQALALAARVAKNAAITNFAVLQALPRIAETDPETGFVLESLMATVAQSDPDTKGRLSDFLGGRGVKVARPSSATENAS